MIGSLSSARLVPLLGPDRTMRYGTLLSTAMALLILIAATQTPVSPWLAGSASFLLFFGIGLTFANAMMGAVSLYPRRAGAASATYGFTHAISAAVIGVAAGRLYDGSLIPTAAIMLGCCLLACTGLWVVRDLAPQPAPSR
jgi:DHA1 family bicyclomycin/chloramphenicol resistance-like MFS transporter